MKLIVTRTGETFDVPRGIGMALIEVAKGAIEEYQPPATGIGPPRTRWTVNGKIRQALADWAPLSDTYSRNGTFLVSELSDPAKRK